MPKLTVVVSGGSREILFAAGHSVREILEGAGLLVRTGCRGNGACGLCLVRVEAGDASAPSQTERLMLPREQLAQNVRLACQLRPENDLHVRILNGVSKLGWRDLDPGCLPCTPSPLILPPPRPAHLDTDRGLAIDLGTTQISLSLWNLKGARRLHARIGPNPQAHFGSDVVSRLIAAGESPENARRLARLPFEAVGEALQELCSREGVRPDEIVRAAVVGNTAMLALVTGADPRQLLQPENWTRPMECPVADLQSWVSLLGIHPQAGIEVVSPLAGFVGSDLLAGVVATRLADEPGSLLIDFGTNSELALWDGKTLWATSAAGGPAFEGCGIQCGMPAEPGAITRFGSAQDARGLELQVLGGGEARGFCGSGLVDLIASLRAGGELTGTGGFASPQHRDGYVVLQTDPPLRLTKKDVDTFQRAKAAVGAGISALLARAQLGVSDLSRVCVCGVFGRSLDRRNAQRIGLLPDTSPERVELCGNTALAGCEHLLLSPGAAAELASLRERAVIVNLSQAVDFDTLFIENLFLQPLRVEKV